MFMKIFLPQSAPAYEYASDGGCERSVSGVEQVLPNRMWQWMRQSAEGVYLLAGCAQEAANVLAALTARLWGNNCLMVCHLSPSEFAGAVR